MTRKHQVERKSSESHLPRIDVPAIVADSSVCDYGWNLQSPKTVHKTRIRKLVFIRLNDNLIRK